MDCPDRRLPRAAAELVARETSDPGTQVTVVLPRRSYPPLLGRLLHDQTADKIARVVSRIPRSAATIIPFDVEARLDVLHERQARQGVKALAPEAKIRAHEQPAVRPGVTPIGSVARNGRATVEGRVHSLEIRPVDHSCVLACQVTDATGEITALFYGRTHIPGVEPGSHDPASRPGRRQGHRRRDGQPRLRTPAVATASSWPGEPPAPSRSPGREGAGQTHAFPMDNPLANGGMKATTGYVNDGTDGRGHT